MHLASRILHLAEVEVCAFEDEHGREEVDDNPHPAPPQRRRVFHHRADLEVHKSPTTAIRRSRWHMLLLGGMVAQVAHAASLHAPRRGRASDRQQVSGAAKAFSHVII